MEMNKSWLNLAAVFCLFLGGALLNGFHGTEIPGDGLWRASSIVAGVAGKYKYEAGGRTGYVSVYPLPDGMINVAVDSVFPIPGGAADCHFNFDVPLYDDTAEFVRPPGAACHIKIVFQPDRLELAASPECGEPASRDYNGNCERGASPISGSYRKVSSNPDLSANM